MNDDDLNTTSLPTISEEDGDSHCSSSTTDRKNGHANASSLDSNDNDGRREKKKKKKAKLKDATSVSASDYDHDTAQQILVDLCTEMKDLKTTMQSQQEKTSAAMTSNLDSNQRVITSLAEQMDMLQRSVRDLDQVIESKATPAQIEELARIRAVQEMMKVVTDDKERTVGVYEQHARRGYEEIERLRQDLMAERKEVAALRAELEIVRGDRSRMVIMNGGGDGKDNVVGASPGGLVIGGPGGGDDLGSLGSGNADGARSGVKFAGVANGGAGNRGGGLRSSLGGSDFDDMTLETKGSYDTQAYEMKSLKKRIIHMKKKLTVAQMEAKEAADLRSEVERLRVQCETEKKASAAKDETIRRLEEEVQNLKRNQANAAGSSASASPSPRKNTTTKTSYGIHKGKSSKTVVTHTKKEKNKWWQNL